MSGDVVAVKGYADLVSDRKLDGDDPDAVARALQNAGEEDLVAWAPDWLVDEKDIEPVSRSENVVSGHCDYETDKAYLVVDGRDEAWLPKSAIRVFTLDEGVDELTIPQSGLTDYATDRGVE